MHSTNHISEQQLSASEEFLRSVEPLGETSPADTPAPQPDENGEFACPAGGAKFMAALGIPQVPLRGKNPSIGGADWQLHASIDFAQIEAWAKKFPGCNFGSVALPKLGEFLIMEADAPTFRERHKKETGRDFTTTLTIQSRPGRGHRYYAQTPGSLALGNIGQNNRVGDFSLRADHEMCVSPGSIHPETEEQYRVVLNVPPVAMSKAEIAWLRSQRKARAHIDLTSTGPKIPYGQHDDFLFKAACKLRGMLEWDEAQIAAHLLDLCVKRCENYGSDYREMCAAKAKQACKFPPGSKWQENFKSRSTSPTASNWDPRGGDSAVEIVSVRACDVVPKPIEFLWEPYIQQNALNAFFGNPGLGKSNAGIDIVARLTTGRAFPTESAVERNPMKCVILAAEEGVADTIVPRLIAAGADLARVRIIQSIRVHGKDDAIIERLITFQQDIQAIRADLQPDENFIFVDPITNYVGEINFNQDGEVRPVLTVLSKLAEDTKRTILIVGHFNKNTNVSSALDKPGGGRAWTAIPRAAWGFFASPENKAQRAMASLKQNNAKESNTTLQFTIEGKNIGTKPNGKGWTVSHIQWGEATDSTADDILQSQHPDARRDTKGVTFLTKALSQGVRKARDVYDEAAKAGLIERTLKRAVETIGVLKFKMPGNGWFWQLPTNLTPIPDAAKELNEAAQERRANQRSSRSEDRLDEADISSLINVLKGDTVLEETL